MVETDFLSFGNRFLLFRTSLLQMETVSETTLRSRINIPHPPPPLIFFEKNSEPPAPRLLIFGFSSLAPKKVEQFKTCFSIRNSMNSNEIDFFECFCFFRMLILNELVKTKQND